jgi:hypothetical protein
MSSQTYFDLLELMHQQELVIQKQGEMIEKLVNDTNEQENLINSLMRGKCGSEINLR